MAKKIILKITDAQEYASISHNKEEFEILALNAQETDLRELLGDALYYVLYNDLDANGAPQNEPYIKLVNGITYTYDGDTIEYFGLKPFLTFVWLAYNVRGEGDNKVTNYGNALLGDDPQSYLTKTSKSERDELNSTYMKRVTSYRNNIVQYLNDNDTEFPTWEGRTENKSKSQFNSFTV